MNLPNAEILQAVARTLEGGSKTVPATESRPLLAKLNNQSGRVHVGTAAIEGAVIASVAAAALLGFNAVRNTGGEQPSGNPRDLLPKNSGNELVIPTPVRPPLQEYATATPTETKTATATKPTTAPATPTVVEKPTSLNAKNLSASVELMPESKFDQIASKNLDGIAFPGYSTSPDFQAQNVTSFYKGPEVNGDVKKLDIEGSDISFNAPIDGDVIIAYQDVQHPNICTGISIKRMLPDNKMLIVEVAIFKDSKPSADISLETDKLTEVKQPGYRALTGKVKRGQHLAKMNGKISVYIYIVDLTAPYTYQNPDGSTQVKKGVSTYITPPIFQEKAGSLQDWLRATDARLAVSASQ